MRLSKYKVAIAAIFLLLVGTVVLGWWYIAEPKRHYPLSLPALFPPSGSQPVIDNQSTPDAFSAFLDAATKPDHESSLSYTAQYQLYARIENREFSNLLQRESVAAFVEQERGGLVPNMGIPEIAASPTDITTYIAAISPSTNSAINDVTSADITEAFRLHWQNPTSGAMQVVIRALESNVTELQRITPPVTLTEVNSYNIALHQSLLTNTQLLEAMPRDYIGGLIAAKNIEELGARFNELAEELAALVP